ncbi:C-4 methylsterol oxidase [Linderina pennispora]|uniref:C-4 methylsterol oxidase n=1 Tax=Linderina pennispora TaxID=61395 RepID=A0A1Y1WCV3_9FUNG|nr:C-4 methylsterol oxidase [Linderina pennispora]ORX71168.1 C-4 methylsterol oxidase [Linderina pennispora]
MSKVIPAGYTPAWAERTWLSLFEGRNEALVFGIIAFTIHQTFYYGRYALQKYKLQPDREISNEQWWKCLKSLIFSQLFVQLPMMMFFKPAADLWTKVVFQVCVFFVIEDFYHYWAHRSFHYGILYKKIHKYAHPLETAILGQGTIAGPLLFNYFVEQVHITTMLIWIAARLWQTVEAHCGYDFPWAMNHWLPFWAGAAHHDYHHMAFVDNFASTFRWWDRVFGTDRRFQAYDAKRTNKVKQN